MSGIRVDAEWLARYADEVRTAGEEVGAAHQELDAARLPHEAFGELGRKVGATDSYRRVADLLMDQTRRAGDAMVSAGEELREVVDFHVRGDDGNAEDLARKQDA
jgi:hypothetical protein